MLGRSDRNHSLMRIVPSHAIKFGTGNETHRNAISSGLFYDALQAQIVAVLGYADPLESAAASLERLGNGIDAVDEVHAKPV